jgi:uncharacterized membrane protein
MLMVGVTRIPLPLANRASNPLLRPGLNIAGAPALTVNPGTEAPIMDDVKSRQGEFPNPDKPTTAKPRPGDFSTVLDRNIKALRQRRKGEDAKAGPETRIAETITRFTGSMPFVYLHIVIVSIWVAANLEWISFIPAFDKTFVILATVTSVEGIFLSTFVLISQNRAAVGADRRAELDVQVNLLSEHEVRRLLQLTVAMAEKIGVDAARDPGLAELADHVAPEKVLDKIEEQQVEDRPG